MKVRQDSRWPNAHVGLRRLYEERVPRGMSQADFGAEFNLGSQGMVWQYLNGYTPLNYDAAGKFAKGLRCNIQDFSPEMVNSLEADLIPFLGRRARKVAAWAFLALSQIIYPAPTADANTMIFVANYVACVLSKIALLRRAMVRFLTLNRSSYAA